MRLRSLVFQVVLIASMAVRPAHAGELFSCYTLGGLNSCAGATFFLEQSPEFGSVLSVSINQWTTPLPLRLTAFALYGKQAPDDFANNFSAPSAWTGLIPLNWTRKANSHVALATLGGHRLFAGSSVPMPAGYDFAVGGPCAFGSARLWPSTEFSSFCPNRSPNARSSCRGASGSSECSARSFGSDRL
jgi:hypothetical protein